MRVEKRYYVYIMASRSKNLYTGVTNNVYRRALEHKSGEVEGFTKKYRMVRLVYYEEFRDVREAIAREKQIKAWTRAKRLALIESMNPTWQDLAEDWGKPFKLQIPRGLEPARDDREELQIPRGLEPARDDREELQIPRGLKPARDDSGKKVGRKETAGQGTTILKKHA